jgi:hypothetical protein
MKGWVFLLPTVTKEDADKHFPEHKVCDVPSGKGGWRARQMVCARSAVRLLWGCVLRVWSWFSMSRQALGRARWVRASGWWRRRLGRLIAALM